MFSFALTAAPRRGVPRGDVGDLGNLEVGDAA
jgi:hypothetical protein